MTQDHLTVDAVIDRDLKRILDEFGLCEKLLGGELHCSICSKVLTFENIGGIELKDKGLELTCDDNFCITEAGKD